MASAAGPSSKENIYATDTDPLIESEVDPQTVHGEVDSIQIYPEGGQRDEDALENSDTSSLVELSGFSGSCLCHPQKLCHKSIALLLMCLLGFGSYFCFDNPGALQNEIKDVMGISTFQFANLYAWYSWPNVVLPIIGGYLIDTIFGLRFGAAFFATALIIGKYDKDNQIMQKIKKGRLVVRYFLSCFLFHPADPGMVT